LPAANHRGFSYIEVLMSLLILCSGFLGYTALMTRIQLVQIQSNQNLKGILMMDYMISQLAIGSEICSNSGDSAKTDGCPSRGALTTDGGMGVVDSSSPLLAGYAESSPYRVDSAAPLGCVSFNVATTTYVVGLYSRGAAVKNQSPSSCGDQPDDFQLVASYTFATKP